MSIEESPSNVDIVLTVGLLVALVIGGLSLSFLALLKQMGVAACSGDPTRCDYTLLAVAFYITPATAIVSCLCVIGGLVWGKRWNVRLWWIPTVGIALTLTAFVLTTALVDAATT